MIVFFRSATDDSTRAVRVGKDSSGSISQSSASDSPKRSSDLTLSAEASPSPIAAQESALDTGIIHDDNNFNKETTRKTNEGIADSLDINRYNSKTRNEAEESTSSSETNKVCISVDAISFCFHHF